MDDNKMYKEALEVINNAIQLQSDDSYLFFLKGLVLVNLEKYEEHKGFIDDLKKIPNFNVVLCDLRKLKINKDKYRYEVKGDDVYLAHDLLIGAFDNLYDVAIIVSSDADFIPVIKTLRKRFKKKVGNAYFRRTSSFKLRKACDFSVNMNMVIGKQIEKRERKRSVPSEDDTSQV